MNQLSKLDFLDNHAIEFKESKKRIENNSKQLQTFLEDNTKKEMDDVKKAIESLNQKMDKLMKLESVQKKQNEIKEDHKKMALSMEVAANTYFKIRKMIYEKNLSRPQRMEYEKKVYNHIISKFLTQEEIEKFEKIIKLGPIMIMSQ